MPALNKKGLHNISPFIENKFRLFLYTFYYSFLLIVHRNFTILKEMYCCVKVLMPDTHKFHIDENILWNSTSSEDST